MKRLVAGLLLCFSAAASADYSEHAGVPQLLATLKQEHGFSDAEIANVRLALVDAQRLPQLVEQEKNAPERTENWSQYSRRIDAARIQGGVSILQEQAAYFARAEEEFGVSPVVIAGIMGVETRYGRITGKIRVLDSLATQGFDHPTRTRFFVSELAHFFVYCRDAGIDPRIPQGSYAGAMGAAQFMPSNYRRLALDYDGNGSKDLWTVQDAIGSIANYFTNFRPTQSWRRGEPLAIRAHAVFPLPENLERNGKATAYTAADLIKAGIVPEVPLPPNTPVGLIELQLDQGVEYWIAFHNFYTVMTYNPRTFYAMAVTQLSLRIQQQLDATPP
ncbi:MAG: lytic murein transglycosylase [Pseudomonadota bacterium]